MASRWRSSEGVGVGGVGGCRLDLPGANPDLDDEGNKFKDVDMGIVGVDVMSVSLWVCPATWLVWKTTFIEVQQFEVPHVVELVVPAPASHGGCGSIGAKGSGRVPGNDEPDASFPDRVVGIVRYTGEEGFHVRENIGGEVNYVPLIPSTKESDAWGGTQ